MSHSFGMYGLFVKQPNTLWGEGSGDPAVGQRWSSESSSSPSKLKVRVHKVCSFVTMSFVIQNQCISGPVKGQRELSEETLLQGIIM